MLEHLLRFSVFILAIMGSFALAFMALFSLCDGDLVFTNFGSSLLTMFGAMLGDFNFSEFSPDEVSPTSCQGTRERRRRHVGARTSPV